MGRFRARAPLRGRTISPCVRRSRAVTLAATLDVLSDPSIRCPVHASAAEALGGRCDVFVEYHRQRRPMRPSESVRCVSPIHPQCTREAYCDLGEVPRRVITEEAGAVEIKVRSSFHRMGQGLKGSATRSATLCSCRLALARCRASLPPEHSAAHQPIVDRIRQRTGEILCIELFIQSAHQIGLQVR